MNVLNKAIVILIFLSTAISLAGCLGQKENLQTPIPNIPDIVIGVDSYRPPAYRGNSTLVNLVITGYDVPKGTEISLDYKTEILRTDGSLEYKPEGIKLIPEQKRLNFQRTVKAEEPPEKLYINLTINVDKKASEGDYYITVSGKDRGLTIGTAILSFKIGKGGKLPLPKRNVWNIGHTRDHPPPLSEEEKAEIMAIAANISYLKDRQYEIVGIDPGFYEFENFSGFFPLVTVDIEGPYRPTVSFVANDIIINFYIPPQNASTSASIHILSGAEKITIYFPVLLDLNENALKMYETPTIEGNVTTTIIDTEKGKALRISGSGLGSYLFSWNDVPGKDTDRFVKWLEDNLRIERPDIRKTDDGGTIIVSGKYPFTESIKVVYTFRLNEEKNKILYDVTGTDPYYPLFVKEENGKLNVYNGRSEINMNEKHGVLKNQQAKDEFIKGFTISMSNYIPPSSHANPIDSFIVDAWIYSDGGIEEFYFYFSRDPADPKTVEYCL